MVSSQVVANLAPAFRARSLPTPRADYRQFVNGMTQIAGEKKARIFQYALVLSGLGVLAFSVVRMGGARGDTRWAWPAVCVLLGSWLATSRVPGANKAVTVSGTFVFLATLLCGIDAGVVVAVLATTGDTARHAKRLLTAATNVVVICCSFFLSG